jgi:hypothetical protein
MGSVMGWALGAFDVTKPFGRIVNGRARHRDLRFATS